MSDLNDLPIVPLPGSEGYRSAYEWGELLDKAFPDQGCDYTGWDCQSWLSWATL